MGYKCNVAIIKMIALKYWAKCFTLRVWVAIIPIVQLRELRLREVKEQPPTHTWPTVMLTEGRVVLCKGKQLV